MNVFDKRFSVLLEQEITPAPPAEPAAPAEAPMVSTVNDVQDNPMIRFQREQGTHMSNSLQEWIGRLDEFNQFLNGLDDNSLQSQLNNAPCDTLFNDVSKSETKKISRIAQDVSGLIESLKGYLLSREEK